MTNASDENALPTPYAGQDTQDAGQGSYQVTDAGPGNARERQRPIDRSTQRHSIGQAQHGSDWADALEHSELSVPAIPPATRALAHAIKPQLLTK